MGQCAWGRPWGKTKRRSPGAVPRRSARPSSCCSRWFARVRVRRRHCPPRWEMGSGRTLGFERNARCLTYAQLTVMFVRKWPETWPVASRRPSRGLPLWRAEEFRVIRELWGRRNRVAIAVVVMATGAAGGLVASVATPSTASAAVTNYSCIAGPRRHEPNLHRSRQRFSSHRDRVRSAGWGRADERRPRGRGRQWRHGNCDRVGHARADSHGQCGLPGWSRGRGGRGRRRDRGCTERLRRRRQWGSRKCRVYCERRRGRSV